MDGEAPHLNASSSARRDFVAFCSNTEITLGPRSIIALAKEKPSSQLLLDHCWRAFDQEVPGQHQWHSPWVLRSVRLEVAYILRANFRNRADVKGRLSEMLARRYSAEAALCLTLIDQNNPVLGQLSYGPKEIGQRLSDWVTALHLAAARSTAGEFFDVSSEMINRSTHSIWDFQDITNRAVVERLQRDPEAVEYFKRKLVSNPSESELASLPRYLAAAGALDENVYERCRSLLQAEAHHPLPRAGYDAGR